MIVEENDWIRLELLEEETVYKLSFRGKNQNKFDLGFSVSLYEALVRIKEECRSGQVLLVVSESKKFFSNGLDLDYVASLKVESSQDAQKAQDLDLFGRRVMPSFGIAAEIKIPSVVLINGHCVGAGLMLALGFDYRIGNTNNKGLIFAPEIAYGMPIPPPEIELFKYAVSYSTFTKMVLEAHKYKSKEALEDGILHANFDLSELEERGMEFAKAKRSISNEAYFAAKKQVKGRVAEYIRDWCEAGLGLMTETNISTLLPKSRI